MGQGHQPPPPQGPCAWEGENPKGEGLHLTWEALLPPWPPLPPRCDLGLAAPLGVGNPKGGAAPFPLYILEVLGLPTHENLSLLVQPYLSPYSSSPVGAWRSPAGLPRSSTTTTPLCCCWTESSSTSPSLLAGSRHGRRHRAVRVLNAEVPSVRHLVIGDLDHDEYDSINLVHLNASALRSSRV